jgi:diadenosine tetraphosphatase ApaH/serine/threonine PP2A family protein phosphatase
VCLFGHTHIPFAATATGDGEVEILLAGDGAGREISVGGGRRYVVNPGSIGQPRDGDPRAAYGVVDTERLTVAFRRVAYPVERARDRIFAAGFPRALGQRLMVGR